MCKISKDFFSLRAIVQPGDKIVATSSFPATPNFNMLLCTMLLIFPLCWGRPEQVHLSFHGDPGKMRVSWINFQDEDATIKWGLDAYNMPFSTQGTKKAWRDLDIVRYVYRATMTGLRANSRYFYQIGDRRFNFTTLSANPQSYKVAIFGDLAYSHGNSTASLITNGLMRKFDFLIHLGDIAYDLHGNNGKTGDAYMNELEPLISTMPYMVIAGNHENDGKNFSHYQNRFWMPDNGMDDNQFYSFDIGPIHWLGLSTEIYGFYMEYGKGPVFAQYNWLQNDLQKANKNRVNTPWIISFQHRPFYCSNVNSAECKSPENVLIRTGMSDLPGMESTFMKYGLDMMFSGHEHSYERTWPIDNNRYFLGNKFMHNPPAPIYVVTGTAGCHTPDAEFGIPRPYSAARNEDYGYTILTVANATHLHFQQISLNKNEEPVDDYWVSKDPGYVHTNGIRENIVGFNTASDFCPPQQPACRRTLQQSNIEL